MNLNQILHDEQTEMRLHSSATSPVDIRKYRDEINRLGGTLSLFSYPHRPYLAPSRAMLLSKSAAPAQKESIASWENEGGAS